MGSGRKRKRFGPVVSIECSAPSREATVDIFDMERKPRCDPNWEFGCELLALTFCSCPLNPEYDVTY
jgi:hypothetical protein